MTSSALYISESVQIHSNHYRASRLSWCKPASTARFWKPHSLKRKEVSSCRTSTPTKRKQKADNVTPQNTHRLQRGSSDKLPDSNGHDGWSSRAEWCPWCAIHRGPPVPICLHAVSQTKSLSIWRPRELMRLEAGVSCPQAHPSSAGGQEKSVKYSISKICLSRAGETQLVDSSRSSETVCCQEIVHVLTASSVCLPPEDIGERKKKSLVWDVRGTRWRKPESQCHQHLLMVTISKLCRKRVLELFHKMRKICKVKTVL